MTCGYKNGWLFLIFVFCCSLLAMHGKLRGFQHCYKGQVVAFLLECAFPSM